ncbi:MlaD family protein [Nocardia sp. CDC160]|uniref:MlaD family protein n=1 Tax=Nocardia sp. CDC160 TaxID=3112166 RepID=UPI002DBA77CA|nr:MlaD family protein [Nocardia sp. CDC160]MEC3919388.1 MlaD family protein [Nocardia sp. CDC160]
MQRVRGVLRRLAGTRRIRWLLELRYGTDTDRRGQRLLGLAGVAAVVVLGIGSAVIYFVPLGKHDYTAMLTDGGSVRAGDDVRVAGISVGSVRSVQLTDDAVRMSFTVDDKVFVGDGTSLEIRMLTPIGGHYIAIFPAGKAPLGSKSIPADRVRLPYSLMQAMQDSQRTTAEIDGDTLRRNLTSLTASLERSPNSVATLTAATSTMVAMLDTQNRDVSRALDVADEYLSLLSDSRSVVGEMLTKIGLMETQVLNRKAEVTEALRVASELFSRIKAIEPSYRQQLEPLADKLVAAQPQLEELGGKLGTVVQNLTDAGNRLRDMLTPQGVAVDQSAQTVQTRPICVPVPGKGC